MSSSIKDLVEFSFEAELVYAKIVDVPEADSLTPEALTEYMQSLKYTNIDPNALKNIFLLDRGTPLLIARRPIGPGYLSRFRMEVSEDTMTCYVILLPPREKEGLTDSTIIINELKAKGIVYGINKEVIETALANRTFKTKIAAASGLWPVYGEDAQMKLLVPCVMNLINVIGQKQPRSLFKEFVLLNQVKEGDCIAEIIPPTSGKKGMTIYGIPLSTVGGEPLELKGRNIMLSENKILAKISGRVILKEQEVDVEPVLKVTEQEVKEIAFNGSVEFFGDVKELPSIRATGDIVVHGSVIHTALNAGRNILVCGNLSSSLDLPVSAGVDFAAMNVSKASIKAENILILSSALKCELLAYRGILTIDPNSTILGGHCKAGRFLLSKVIGNERKVHTSISIATPDVMQQHREQILAPFMLRIKEIKKESARIARRVAQVATLEKEMNAREKKAYARMQEELQLKITECEAKEKEVLRNVVRIKDTKNQMAVGDVSANLYNPPLSLKMGHCERQVTEAKENLRFHLKDSAIYIESFDKKDKGR